MNTAKVLVVGDDTRSFLATVRSLGRQGVTVHAAPTNFRSPALRSRYVAAIHDLPPWMGDDAEWLEAVTKLLVVERYELVIPCDETMLLPLQRHRATLSTFARLAIPDDRTIGVLFDKHETRELARRVGVRVAAGRTLRFGDAAEDVLTEFGVPVVVKPRRSYVLEGLATRRKVQVVSETARLARLLNSCKPDETLIEQYFSGQGIGVSVLASRGTVLQAFEHHRVHEIEGASFYRHSAPLTPHLAGACQAIVAALEYTGIAMFEFKQNAGGEWVLLEVNARPWGSMPVAVAAGVDFPYRWYRLLTAGEETPAVPYRTGVYGRNLVPDLQIALLQAGSQRGRLGAAWFMTQRLAELLRFLSGKEVHDVLVRDDPRPGLIELAEMIRAVQRRAETRLPGATGRRRRRARAQATALRNTVVSPKLVFVCQGNICRSPFAEALLRARLPPGMLKISSAGVMPQPGRPTPGFGLETAAAHGVDLSSHRSAWLSPELVDSACLLIVFDEFTRRSVFDRYPNLKTPVMLLGDLVGLGDVVDPINGGAAEFTRVYSQIAAAITELARVIS